MAAIHLLPKSSSTHSPALTPNHSARPWIFYLCIGLLTLVVLSWLLLGLVPVLYKAGIVPVEVIKRVVEWIREATPYKPWTSAIVSASYRSQKLHFVIYQYLFSLLNLGMASILVYLRPWDWVARLFAIGMVGTAAIFNLESHVVQYFGGPMAEWIHSWLHSVAGGSYLLALVLFPHGKFPPLPVGDRSIPQTISLPFQVLVGLLIALFGSNSMWDGEPEAYVLWYGMIAPIFGIIAQSLRYRLSKSEEERQLCKFFIWAMGLAIALTVSIGIVAWLLSLPFLHLLPHLPHVPLALRKEIIFFAFPLLYTFLPLSLTWLVLRYRLWGLELLIKRSLIYGALAFIIALLYVLLVGGLSQLLRGSENWLLSILTTGLIAILFQPLRLHLQRMVNRLFYGQRDEPAKVLSDLGARLAAIMAPSEALSAVVKTIGRALKLPYVALYMQQGENLRIVAEVGEPLAGVESIPIYFHGDRLGLLRIAPRSSGETLTSGDLRLLGEVANQAGAALHAMRLTIDLQRSREELVTAQEEERRRLRRDLHDGLGPQLATLSLKIDAARNLLQKDPDRANQLLAEYKAQTQDALADLRRVVYDLRPPTLDQLGLRSAIEQHLETYAADNIVEFKLDMPNRLPPLLAAVEVAAYRITLEAVTNVLRHAKARHCTVRLAIDGGLQIEVKDDGLGRNDADPAGVGILSMRERAAELGGHCEVRGSSNGTVVNALLPLLIENSR